MFASHGSALLYRYLRVCALSALAPGLSLLVTVETKLVVQQGLERKPAAFLFLF
jgi:hypothetical protein